MGAVVSAFDLFVAGNAVKLKALCDALFDYLERGLLVGVKQQQIKAGATAHRPEIHHFVFELAVANDGGKKMLYGVHCRHVQIVALVWLFEAQIVGEHVFVHSAEIQPLFEHVVVYGERSDFLHDTP